MRESNELQTCLYASQKLLMRSDTSQAESLPTLWEALQASKEWTQGEIVNTRTREVLLNLRKWVSQ